MKKSLTRKLAIAIIALVFAVVSLSTSTYAWFTMSDTASVDAFTADVQAAEGIEIAVTADGVWQNADFYTGNIPSSVVQAAANPLSVDEDDTTNFAFEALTTKDGFKFYGTKLDETNKQTVVNYDEEQTKGYVSFYVHVRAAQNGTINVQNVALSTVGSTIKEWIPGVDYYLDSTNNNKVVATDTIKYQVSNAARVAIINADKSESSIFEADVAPASKDDVTAWTAGNTTGTTNTFGAFDVYNQKNVDATLDDLEGVEQYDCATVGELSATVLDYVEDVTANEVITLQVKVWIEGYDAECINAIFAQTLKVSLVFAWKDANSNEVTKNTIQ